MGAFSQETQPRRRESQNSCRGALQRAGASTRMPPVPLLVFAYGSLIFRPSRFFGEPRPAVVRGYRRAFRQASPDHRGTPEHPGRVVTLIRDEAATCAGVVYE